MPSQETAFLTDDAVLWPRTGYNRYGEPTVGSPIELKVRWENTRREVLDKDGNSVSIDATVFTDRDIREGSNLWHGTLADWYGTGSGSSPAGQDDELMYVKFSEETEDIKGRCTQRTVMLMRYRQTLPSS